MKKFISILLIMILIFTCINFVGCAHEEYNISIELVLICIYPSISEKDNFVLSEESPTLEITQWNDSAYGFQYGAAAFITRKSDNSLVDWFQLDLAEDFMPFYLRKSEIETTYQIVDKDGQIRNGKFISEDFFLDNQQQFCNRILDRSGVTHKLSYHIPKMEVYGIEETTFEFTLNIEKDTRNHVEIKGSTDLGEVNKYNNYDVYNTNKINFSMHVLDTEETYEMFPYGNDNVDLRCRKLDLNGFGRYSNWVSLSETTEPGLYWFCLMYKGGNVNRGASYEFFVLIK